MARTAAVLLACLMAMPALALVKPKENPANSKTIEGKDCGNVKSIIGKWAKSKKVGELAGNAKAAIDSAKQASTNADAAVKAAEALGKKVGQDGKAPSSVTDAAKVATAASTAATKAAIGLKTLTSTFKGKFDDFAKAVSNDDIVKMEKDTIAANDAAQDAVDATERVVEKAEEAKAAAMKNTAGALALIKAQITASAELSTKIMGPTPVGIIQKTGFAVKDLDTIIGKSEKLVAKLDKKANAKDTKEQKPVWESYSDAVTNAQKAAEDARDAVGDDSKGAIKDVITAHDAMKKEEESLQKVADAAQSSQSAALGQAEAVAAAEAAVRETEEKLSTMMGKVMSMKKTEESLVAEMKDRSDRLGNA